VGISERNGLRGSWIKSLAWGADLVGSEDAGKPHRDRFSILATCCNRTPTRFEPCVRHWNSFCTRYMVLKDGSRWPVQPSAYDFAPEAADVSSLVEVTLGYANYSKPCVSDLPSPCVILRKALRCQSDTVDYEPIRSRQRGLDFEGT
jgi:hypothetical protein